ncbi:MAG: radical SAM protein, partial [Bacillota bacterium]|nr:radical SAM protein [Bacillota bacterium]
GETMREVQAKTLILGPYHNYNVYRGCTHGCIYCDSRSSCYEIEPPFEDIIVKVNAPALAAVELAKKKTKIVCRSGSMCDPYMPIEEKLELSRRVLEVILKYGHGASFLTKNALALRDLDLFEAIAKNACAVACFTITTTDDELARRIEPSASPPSERLKALSAFAERGIVTGVWMTPVLPWITASEENIRAVVAACAEARVKYIVGTTATTMRDGSREHFYARLDEEFPGLRRQYEQRYGTSYVCKSPGSDHLWDVFTTACDAAGIAWREADIARFFTIRERHPQMSLFDEM